MLVRARFLKRGINDDRIPCSRYESSKEHPKLKLIPRHDRLFTTQPGFFSFYSPLFSNISARTSKYPWFRKRKLRQKKVKPPNSKLLQQIPYRVIILILGYLHLEVMETRGIFCCRKHGSQDYCPTTQDVIRIFFGYFKFDFTRKPFLVFPSFTNESQKLMEFWSSSKIFLPKRLQGLNIKRGTCEPNSLQQIPHLESLTVRKLNGQTFPDFIDNLAEFHPKLKILDLGIDISKKVVEDMKKDDLELIKIPPTVKKLSLGIRSDVILAARDKKIVQFPPTLESLTINLGVNLHGFGTLRNTNILIRQLLTHKLFQEMDCVENLKELHIHFPLIHYLPGEEENSAPVDLHPCYYRTFHFLKRIRSLRTLRLTGSFVSRHYITLSGDDITDLYELPWLRNIKIKKLSYFPELMDRKQSDVLKNLQRPDLSIQISNMYFVKPDSERDGLTRNIEDENQFDFSENTKQYFHLPDSFAHLSLSFVPGNPRNKPARPCWGLGRAKQCGTCLTPLTKLLGPGINFPSVQTIRIKYAFLPANIFRVLPLTVKRVNLESCKIRQEKNGESDSMDRSVRSYDEIVLDKVRFDTENIWTKFFAGKKCLKRYGKFVEPKRWDDREKYYGKYFIQKRKFRFAGESKKKFTKIEAKQVLVLVTHLDHYRDLMERGYILKSPSERRIGCEIGPDFDARKECAKAMCLVWKKERQARENNRRKKELKVRRSKQIALKRRDLNFSKNKNCLKRKVNVGRFSVKFRR